MKVSASSVFCDYVFVKLIYTFQLFISFNAGAVFKYVLHSISKSKFFCLFLCRCTGLEERNLPCGGLRFNTWSVYAASGPFIVKVEIQGLSPWIEPNIPTTLEAVVMFKEFVDITEGNISETCIESLNKLIFADNQCILYIFHTFLDAMEASHAFCILILVCLSVLPLLFTLLPKYVYESS